MRVRERKRESFLETHAKLQRFARARIESVRVVRGLRARAHGILKDYVTKVLVSPPFFQFMGL